MADNTNEINQIQNEINSLNDKISKYTNFLSNYLPVEDFSTLMLFSKKSVELLENIIVGTTGLAYEEIKNLNDEINIAAACFINVENAVVKKISLMKTDVGNLEDRKKNLELGNG